MDNYIGEIKAFPYNFVPQGWLPCDGRQVAIVSQQALFTVISNKYGGDGRTYFNLPDLRGVVPMGATGTINNMAVGQTGGVESVALNFNQMPAHNHTIQAVKRASITGLTNKPSATTYLTDGASSTNQPVFMFSTNQPTAAILHTLTIGPAGSATPVAHENRMPFLPMNFGICIEGTYPPHQD